MSIYEYITLSVITLVLIADNFRISLSLGLSSNIKDSHRKWVAFTFGIFESITAIVGLTMGAVVSTLIVPNLTEYIVSVLIGGYGLYLILLTRIKNIPRFSLNHRWLLFGLLPFSLSIDNLVVSTGMGVYHIPIIPYAIIIGLASSVITLVGIYLGDTVKKHLLMNRTDIFCGIILFGIGLSLAAISFD
jgi:putative Mn2+ efflux pump MntP